MLVFCTPNGSGIGGRFNFCSMSGLTTTTRCSDPTSGWTGGAKASGCNFAPRGAMHGRLGYALFSMTLLFIDAVSRVHSFLSCAAGILLGYSQFVFKFGFVTRLRRASYLISTCALGWRALAGSGGHAFCCCRPSACGATHSPGAAHGQRSGSVPIRMWRPGKHRPMAPRCLRTVSGCCAHVGECGGWPSVPGLAPLCLLMAYPPPAAAACAIVLLDVALSVAAVCNGRGEGGFEFVRQALRGRMVQDRPMPPCSFVRATGVLPCFFCSLCSAGPLANALSRNLGVQSGWPLRPSLAECRRGPPEARGRRNAAFCDVSGSGFFSLRVGFGRA